MIRLLFHGCWIPRPSGRPEVRLGLKLKGLSVRPGLVPLYSLLHVYHKLPIGLQHSICLFALRAKLFLVKSCDQEIFITHIKTFVELRGAKI